MPRPNEHPLAIFMDLSAIFFAIRDLYPDQQMTYGNLSEVIVGAIGQAPSRRQIERVAWTSYSESNQGQARFLAHLESTWAIRRFAPSDSFMVDPGAMNLGPGDRSAQRLIRFDASIAFAIGVLAKTHEIVVVSDSFALAEPLIRAAKSRGSQALSHVAFFGRSLDGRWSKLLRDGSFPARLIDLDDHEERLFGTRRTGATDAFADDFLIR
jgi:hypothetical protein